MKYLKFVILLLVLCNLPGYSLIHHGTFIGAFLSYCTFLFIIAYYFLCKKEKPVVHFIIFGCLFFSISLIVNAQFNENFIGTFIKYFIFIIMMSSVLRYAKNEEIYGILLIGCLSIIYEAIFVTGSGGISTGLYLNPNLAAYTCILGYAFGLTIKNKSLKAIGQVLFTVAGLVTFSITFLIIWLLINLFSVFANTKNIYRFIGCLTLLAAFVSFGDKLHLNKQPTEVFSGISGGRIDDNAIKGGRAETWTLYYDKILENPLWGNGYGQTAKAENVHFTFQIGIHNIFVMIMGEAGIFALCYFFWIYGYVTMKSLYFFKQNPSVFCISFALILYMLTSRNYFDDYIVLFTSLWLYHEIYKMKSANWLKTRIIVRASGSGKESNEENLIRQYHLN